MPRFRATTTPKLIEKLTRWKEDKARAEAAGGLSRSGFRLLAMDAITEIEEELAYRGIHLRDGIAICPPRTSRFRSLPPIAEPGLHAPERELPVDFGMPTRYEKQRDDSIQRHLRESEAAGAPDSEKMVLDILGARPAQEARVVAGGDRDGQVRVQASRRAEDFGD